MHLDIKGLQIFADEFTARPTTDEDIRITSDSFCLDDLDALKLRDFLIDHFDGDPRVPAARRPDEDAPRVTAQYSPGRLGPGAEPDEMRFWACGPVRKTREEAEADLSLWPADGAQAPIYEDLVDEHGYITEAGRDFLLRVTGVSE